MSFHSSCLLSPGVSSDLPARGRSTDPFDDPDAVPALAVETLPQQTAIGEKSPLKKAVRGGCQCETNLHGIFHEANPLPAATLRNCPKSSCGTDVQVFESASASDP